MNRKRVGRWLWITGSGILILAILAIVFVVNRPSARLTTSVNSDLVFSRTIYDQHLADELAKVPDHVLVAGPLFRAKGVPVQLFEFGADLQLQGSRAVKNSFFYAGDFDTAGNLTFTGGGCPDKSGAWAACASVDSLTPSAETTDPSSAALRLDFHEFEADGQGGYWAIRYENVICDQQHEKNCGVKPDGTRVPSIGDCHIVHVEKGRIKSEWSAYDHLPDGQTRGARYGEFADVFHCNSIDSYTIDGARKLLVSMRNTDSIFQIDVASGVIDWKLGGTEMAGASLTLSNPGTLGITGELSDPSQILSGQHDARYVGNGQFSVFDNGSKTNRAARGLVFSVDPKNHTATINKVFIDPSGVTSGCTGSFRPIHGGAYWVAGWGCSNSGITVFAADTTPIVTTRLDQAAPANLRATNADMGEALRWTLSYRAIVEK